MKDSYLCWKKEGFNFPRDLHIVEMGNLGIGAIA